MTTRDDTIAFLRTLARAEDAAAGERWDDAARLWAGVTATNPVNGRYWLRLGEARYHVEDFRGAVEAFTRAVTLGDDSPPETMVRIAQCHARLGDHDAALAWIERAFDARYHDLDGLRECEDLAALHDHPRFRDLAGIDGANHESRVDGWRADLRFAAREIKRRAYAPFGVISEAEFDAFIARIDTAIPDLTDHQVIVELTRLVRQLNDGHARVRPPKDRDDLQRAVPLQFFLFEDGFYVTAADPEHESLLGAEVVAIGDHAIEAVLAAFEPVVARDNENGQWFKACLPSYLRESSVLCALGLIPDADRVPLTVRDAAGTTRTVSIAADPAQPAWKLRNAFPAPEGWRFLPETLEAPLPLYLRNASLPFWFEYLSEARTVYFQFNRVQDAANESIAAVSQRLFGFIESNDVEKLVIDMRWNGGGNTFKELPFLRRIIACDKINRHGSLFVIIGRDTFSAAQNGVNFLSHHSEAIFAGEPTGSSPIFIGETRHFELPYSKTVMNVSDLRWVGTWPDDHRIWLPPTLYAPPAFAMYRENRDPAMEAILACREHLPAPQN